MKKPKFKLLKEFKEFISRGNVMDLAVGMIIGAAFTAIITAVVNGILKPLINLIPLSETGLQTVLRPAVVDAEGNVTYQVNETLCQDIYKYYQTYVANRYCLDEYAYDTSYLKMKELRVEYTLPKKLVAKAKIIQGASLACYATNLFCITNYPFFDPDCGTIDGATIKRGLETGSFPMNRSYGVNLKVKF